ncbi:MAG: hypothetical protein JWM20_720 [Patescibacteria group bacterium]|nr:hypothetical protein [Patescibacteria group bacterium]
MKKPFLTLLLFVSIARMANAQGEGLNWCFGDSLKIVFQDTAQVVSLGSVMSSDLTRFDYPQEGTSCISDQEGNLLFYSSGRTVWNRDNRIMPHGRNLFGGPSATQSSVIVPLPGSDSIYYLFTTGQFQEFYDQGAIERGLRYSVIDMSLDAGNGDVDTSRKNVLLMDTSTEKLAATIDADSSGYWIVGHKVCSDAFYAWHLTAGGITDTVISHTGTFEGGHVGDSTYVPAQGQGQMKISPDGSRIAMVTGNKSRNVLNLFHFDNSSGTVSDLDTLLIRPYGSGYGVEFSPDGSKVYATNSGGMMPDQGLYQFDLRAGNGNRDSIQASISHIFTSSTGVSFGLQLGPDGRIYAVLNSYHDLSRINSPNQAGLGCGFDSGAVVLPTVSGIIPPNNYSLPTFVAGYHYVHLKKTSPLGIKRNDLSADIFPNPGVNSITIQSEGTCQGYLNDVSGRLVKSFTFRNIYNLEKNDISSGTYFLTIRNREGLSAAKKIVFE